MASQNQSSAALTTAAGTPNQHLNSTPSSNPGVIGAAPQQAHSHAHPPHQTGVMQPKVHVTKTLPETATRPPAAVQMHQSRPTLSTGTGTPGGAMGQPANPKVPAYQHQDEGEHVLSKKRLDDLVRQVCGGTAEGRPANLLTAEVEEVGYPLAGPRLILTC
jgi:transcription initiation factor TFIID subunit 12